MLPRQLYDDVNSLMNRPELNRLNRLVQRIDLRLKRLEPELRRLRNNANVDPLSRIERAKQARRGTLALDRGLTCSSAARQHHSARQHLLPRV